MENAIQMHWYGFDLVEAEDKTLTEATYYWLNRRTGERREASDEYCQAVLAS